jgi:hypothetical protein
VFLESIRERELGAPGRRETELWRFVSNLQHE